MSSQYKQGMVWKDIKIGNSVYMVSLTRRDNMMEVILTNLIEIWMETLTDEIILNRCKTLNPLLNVEALNYKDTVANILSNLSKHIIEATVEQIKLCAKVQGGSMKFTLNLSKGTPQNFWELITKPLCVSSMEILRQHKILLDLIKKKDEEIAEYKAEGAELIRKNIETKPFEEGDLKTDIPIPNSIDCTNAFQAMVNFYNALNLCDSQPLMKPESCTITNNITEKIKESIIISTEDDNTNGSKEVTSNDTLIQSKPGTSKSSSICYENATTTKNATGNKTRVMNVAHKPIKKSKKGLNDFIL